MDAPKEYQVWYIDKALAGVCNHEDKDHIFVKTLHRYFFARLCSLM